MRRKTLQARPLAERVLLVRLKTRARVLQAAIGKEVLVVQASSLHRACQAVESASPAVIIVSDSFPELEVQILRSKASTLRAHIQSAPANTDLATLIALVQEGRTRRCVPQL